MLPQRPPFASRPLLPPLLLRLLHPLQRQSPLSQLHQSRRHPLLLLPPRRHQCIRPLLPHPRLPPCRLQQSRSRRHRHKRRQRSLSLLSLLLPLFRSRDNHCVPRPHLLSNEAHHLRSVHRLTRTSHRRCGLQRHRSRRGRVNLLARCLRATAVLCRLAIVDRFPRTGPAARVRASRCARSKVAGKGKAVRSHRVLEDRADPAVHKIVLLISGAARFPRERVPVRACPAGQPCCRRCRTKCRRRQSPASRFTRAVLRNASGPSPTSARWKASASFIRRASVLAAIAVLPLPLLLHRSHALHATLQLPKELQFANSRKSWMCAQKNF